MVSAARDFAVFNEAAQFVRIIKSDPHEVHRYKVVGVDGKVVSRGNTPAFVLDRASFWEQRYAREAQDA